MPARLVPASEGKSIRLDKPVLLIGRNPDCDVILKCSRKVSRQHCLVAVANSRVIVRDLSSTNGVWINGHRVERESRVKIGDELAIADVLYYLINEEQAGRESPDSDHGSERRNHQTLDEPRLREAGISSGDLDSESLQADLLSLEPGIDVPVPIPEEEDSFAVEASMPRLPRISPGDMLADRGQGRQDSGVSRPSARSPSGSRGDPGSDPSMHFRSADEDSDEIIPQSPRDR